MTSIASTGSSSTPVAVVTGGARGIGLAIAQWFLANGHRVALLDIDLETLTATAARLNNPQGVLALHCDVSEPAQVQAAIEAVDAAFGRIDALINNAGIAVFKPIGETTFDEWRRVLAVNLDGAFLCSQACVPLMSRSGGGAIVNIASILGAEWPQRLEQHKALAEAASFEAGLAFLARHPVPQDSCYQYFKEALIVWTITQSQPWFLQHGVRMNCVAPGPVFTPILGDFVQMLGQERVEKDAHRMKRPAFSDEVAPVIAFLCSDAARWVSGINLPVDGGLASTYL